MIPLGEDHLKNIMGIDLTIGLDDEAGGEFVRIDDVDEVVGHNGGVVHRGNRLLQSLVNVNSFFTCTGRFRSGSRDHTILGSPP